MLIKFCSSRPINLIKTQKFVFLIFLIIMSIQAYSQEYLDVVYLKNGSIIKGNIVELIPNESVKLKTADGSLFVFTMDEIEKIDKEEVISVKPLENQYNTQKQLEYELNKKNPTNVAMLGCLVPSLGHAQIGQWGRGALFLTGEVACIVLAITVGYDEYGNAEDLSGIMISSAIGFHLLGAIDAYFCTQKYNTRLYESIMKKPVSYNNTINIKPVTFSYNKKVGLGLSLSYNF